MKTTNLFIIIDEEKLEVFKSDTGQPLKFKTKDDANMFAAERLEMWQVFNVHFTHKFLRHTI